MRTYRILGTLWLIFCGYGLFNDLKELLSVSFPSNEGLWQVRCVLATFCLLDLAGVAVSLFLVRGARWARWFIGLFAIFKVVCGIVYGDGEIFSHLHYLYYGVCLCICDRFSCAFTFA